MSVNPKQIIVKLYNNDLMLCDEDDYLRYCLVTGMKNIYVSIKGYACYNIGNQIKYFHCFIMGFPDCQVDHINGDKLDNRQCNLRLVTDCVNKRNLNDALQRNNKSGTRGISWCEKRNKWLAQITVDRKRINLGRFFLKESAIRARESAEKKFGFTKPCQS